MICPAVASRSIIFRSRKLRQIIDLRDTGKSRYSAITEINVLSFDHQVRFYILLTSWQLRYAISHFLWFQLLISRILFAAKHKHEHERTIICRQLFAGHLVGSWPTERKKNASNEK